MEFNLFLCSQVTAAPCFVGLFNYFFLFMQLANRLQPFIYYNTVICIVFSILRLNFWYSILSCGRQRTVGKPRMAACSNLPLHGVSRSRNRTGCPSASQSLISNMHCKAQLGLRPVCLSSYASPKNS